MVEWGVVDICVRAADSGNAKHKFISLTVRMTFTSHNARKPHTERTSQKVHHFSAFALATEISLSLSLCGKHTRVIPEK